MKLQLQGDTLRITGVPELGAASSATLREEACSAMSPHQRNIDIDLSQAFFLDRCGLGVLIALHKIVCSQRGMVRLLNPIPVVREVLTLTHRDCIFDVTTA